MLVVIRIALRWGYGWLRLSFSVTMHAGIVLRSLQPSRNNGHVFFYSGVCRIGRSGPVIIYNMSIESCLTAVREVLGSNRAVGSCVYRKNHWYTALGTGCVHQPAVLRSTQPSTLRGTVNWHQLSVWVITRKCTLWRCKSTECTF